MRSLLLLLFCCFALAGEAIAETKTAVFGGGCFWCMEKPFDLLAGVTGTVSGFAGGHLPNPSYDQVTQGDSGHIEVVQVSYDPAVVSYQKLLEVYWANVDPLDEGGQFCDRGHSYTTAIFFADAEQKRLTQQSKRIVEAQLQGKVVTTLRPLDQFYAAEEYHQNFYQTNSLKYKYYRWRCGRDDRLEDLWGERAGEAVPLF